MSCYNYFSENDKTLFFFVSIQYSTIHTHFELWSCLWDKVLLNNPLFSKHWNYRYVSPCPDNAICIFSYFAADWDLNRLYILAIVVWDFSGFFVCLLCSVFLFCFVWFLLLLSISHRVHNSLDCPEVQTFLVSYTWLESHTFVLSLCLEFQFETMGETGCC